MEKRLKAKSDNYPEDIKDDVAAALFLVSLKCLQFDFKTEKALCVLKNKILAKIEANPVAEIQPQLQQIPPAGNLLEFPQFGPWNPPEFPAVERLNGLIGMCSRPFEKQLTDSDVNDDQSRLSINKADVENYLMPLLNPEENLQNGIPVTTYDFQGNEFQMMFKIWGSKIHVLTGEWKKFVHKHHLLGLQDFVTVWMFRHVQSEKLCIVITSRRLPVYTLVKKPKTMN